MQEAAGVLKEGFLVKRVSAPVPRPAVLLKGASGPSAGTGSSQGSWQGSPLGTGFEGLLLAPGKEAPSGLCRCLLGELHELQVFTTLPEFPCIGIYPKESELAIRTTQLGIRKPVCLHLGHSSAKST